MLQSEDRSVRESVLKTIEEAQMESCQEAAFELSRNARVDDGQRERAFIAALAAGQARGPETAELAVSLLARRTVPQELGVRFTQALLRFISRLPEPLPDNEHDRTEVAELARRAMQGEAVAVVPWSKDAAQELRTALQGMRYAVTINGPIARLQASRSTTTLVALKQGRKWILAGAVKQETR